MVRQVQYSSVRGPLESMCLFEEDRPNGFGRDEIAGYLHDCKNFAETQKGQFLNWNKPIPRFGGDRSTSEGCLKNDVFIR